MVENVTTAFILLGGLVGIALGVYGLAPALFPHRLRGAHEFLYGGDPDYSAPDEAESEYAQPDEAGLAPVFASAAEEQADEWTLEATASEMPFSSVEPTNEAQLEVQELLEIFSEVCPDSRPTPAQAALGTTKAAPVSISELLADARWTALALAVATSGVPAR